MPSLPTWRANMWADINLFPSWLLHLVCPYGGTAERISIAFNLSL